jgi:hypothetical protein
MAGAAAVAWFDGRARRGLGLVVFGGGIAGLDAALSAGFAAVLVLACYLAIAWTLALRPGAVATIAPGPFRPTGQAAAAVAALTLVALLYTAFRSDLHHGVFPGGGFDAAALSRVLFGREAMGLVAATSALLVAGAAASAAGRRLR